MNTYSVLTLVEDEQKANNLADVLDKIKPGPVGIGVFLLEDGSRAWEVGAYFTNRPDQTSLLIIEKAFRITFLCSKVSNTDWVAQVQRDLTPVYAERFVIHSKHYRDIVPSNKINLEIEAAMAFGTGHHASTKGCLLAFHKLLKFGYRFSNFLDLGCGSGVLAMAAAKATRKNGIAVDVDPVAVRCARENIYFNGLGGYVSVFLANGFRNIRIISKAPFGLIFANIVS